MEKFDCTIFSKAWRIVYNQTLDESLRFARVASVVRFCRFWSKVKNPWNSWLSAKSWWIVKEFDCTIFSNAWRTVYKQSLRCNSKISPCSVCCKTLPVIKIAKMLFAPSLAANKFQLQYFEKFSGLSPHGLRFIVRFGLDNHHSTRRPHFKPNIPLFCYR